MLDQVLDIFNLVPDVDLNIMQEEQDLFDVTASIIVKIRDTLQSVKPDSFSPWRYNNNILLPHWLVFIWALKLRMLRLG